MYSQSAVSRETGSAESPERNFRQLKSCFPYKNHTYTQIHMDFHLHDAPFLRTERVVEEVTVLDSHSAHAQSTPISD
jgi:hypothetical protein